MLTLMASVSKAPDFLLYDYLLSMDNVFANIVDELEMSEDEMTELLGTFPASSRRFSLPPLHRLLAIRFSSTKIQSEC